MTASNNLCSTCGTITQYRIEGRIQGQYCEICSAWQVVTTYFSALELDQTLYRLKIMVEHRLKPEQLKALSAMLNLNYLEIRRAIDQQKPLTLSGKAKDIGETIKTLTSVNLAFECQPPFPQIID
ncbi:hypothetical protein [Aestuariispira insulae]|uniref:Uncharacterized protein n=1 Tax=Aestuariispira insulae TaxID=1461337 RepID=A0A3D9HJR3_9PROT|nr:hypothetical protein [Aestuariispira insulae]RED49752.1 hypothetical protein DFP90_105123 [Aestuariispira insulae]